MPRRKRYPYVQRNPDGRCYLRKLGFPRVPLPVPFGSHEFEVAYFAAISSKPLEIGVSRTIPRSMNALIVAYYESVEFKGLRPSTARVYRNILEQFREGYGDKDAAFGVKRLKHHGTGFATWAESDIAVYRNYYPLGTRERLVLELAIWTAQRRGDLVRIGWRHVINGAIAIKQNKTGAEVTIPIVQELRAALDLCPRDRLTFIAQADGRPLGAASLGNEFREWLRKGPWDIRPVIATRAAQGRRQASRRRGL